MKWEKIDDNMYRTKVFRGWIVKILLNYSVSITFVDDRYFEWKLDE